MATLVDNIGRIASEKDDRYVVASVATIGSIDALLSQLSSAAGKDDEAKRIAYQWPKYTQELLVDFVAMKAMKDAQFRTDGLDQKCADAEVRLAARITELVNDPQQHERAISGLPGEAETVADPIRRGLADADQVNSNMGSWLSTAKGFSNSDGPWATVPSPMGSAAQGEYDYWTVHYWQMKTACKQLALGAKHPDVLRAVADMS